MPRNRVPALLGLAAIASLGALTASACVVRAGGSAQVRTAAVVDVEAEAPAAEITVRQYPPEPQYEEVTVSPGVDFVWTPGYWNWDGYNWVWARGRWDRRRVGYIYVNPYYDNVGGRFVYRAGYWVHRNKVPRGYVVRGDYAEWTVRDTRAPRVIRVQGNAGGRVDVGGGAHVNPGHGGTPPGQDRTPPGHMHGGGDVGGGVGVDVKGHGHGKGHD